MFSLLRGKRPSARARVCVYFWRRPACFFLFVRGTGRRKVHNATPVGKDMLSDSPLLVFFLSTFGVSRISFKGRTGTRQSEDCLEHRCQLCMVDRPRGSSSFRQVSRRRGANQVGRGVGRCLACLPVCLAAAVHQEARGEADLLVEGEVHIDDLHCWHGTGVRKRCSRPL